MGPCGRMPGADGTSIDNSVPDAPHAGNPLAAPAAPRNAFSEAMGYHDGMSGFWNGNPLVVVVGAGAVGSTVAGWLAQVHGPTVLVARGATAERLRTNGLRLEGADRPDVPACIAVDVREDLADGPVPDLVILAVKTYSLGQVAATVEAAVGRDVPILGLQNGVENQRILPARFEQVLYGVVNYNAWRDEPGRVGYQKRGPLIVGALDPRLKPLRDAVVALLDPALPTEATDRIEDAAHCKLVINLANALATLVGHGLDGPPLAGKELDAFQLLLTQTLEEGRRIVAAAGYREHRLAGAPPWRLIRLSATLPRRLTRPVFKRNLAKMRLNSMAQDVVGRGGDDSELESINGRILELAEETGAPAPFNRTIYRIARERFGPEFTPMTPSEILAEVPEP